MLPLAHRRVLVTRARTQASALAQLLEQQGATAILLPAIEIAQPRSWCGLDAAITALNSFDWLLFSSANAVHALIERARQLGVVPHPRRIAAIGPATARAVLDSGLAPAVDLMPEQFVAEAFAEALVPYCSGAAMLLVRAESARDVLPDVLRNNGANLSIVDAYRTIIPAESLAALPALLGPPNHEAVDAITFTSASTARNLAALLEAAGQTLPSWMVLASIGPVTSAAMCSAGLPPTVEAAEATIASLVSALSAHFAGTPQAA